MRELVSDGDQIGALTLGLKLRSEPNDARSPETKAQVEAALARLYVESGNPENGLRSANSGLADADVLSPNLQGRLLLYKTMALIRLGRYEAANRFANKLRVLASRFGEEELLAESQYMIASSLSRTNQSEPAEAAYRQAAAMFQAGGFDFQHRRVTNDLAMNYKIRGRYNEALTIFESLLPQSEAADDQQMIVYTLLELGDIERLLGNFNRGEVFLIRALEIAKAAENRQWQAFAHEYLAELNRERGDINQAILHTNELSRHQAEMQTENAVARLAELELRRLASEQAHEMQMLEKEAEIAALDVRRTRSRLIAISLGAVLLAMSATLLFRRLRQQMQANARLKASNIALDQAARTDELTGLANRRALSDRLEHLSRARMRYALILLDLDFFKRINDEYGHDHGDAVLVEVAQRIKARLRQTDLAVRWGGEEFLILLTETGPSQAHDIASQLHEQIRKRAIVCNGEAHFVTATFGVATSLGHADFDSVLKGADDALAHGKRAGRDKIAFQDCSETGSVRAVNLVA